MDLVPLSEFKDLDCLIIAVAHKEFKALLDEDIEAMFKNEPNKRKVIVDVKGVRDKNTFISKEYKYFRL